MSTTAYNLAAVERDPTSVEAWEAFWRGALKDGVPCRGTGPDEDGDCERCGLDWDNENDTSHECPPGFRERDPAAVVEHWLGSDTGEDSWCNNYECQRQYCWSADSDGECVACGEPCPPQPRLPAMRMLEEWESDWDEAAEAKDDQPWPDCNNPHDRMGHRAWCRENKTAAAIDAMIAGLMRAAPTPCSACDGNGYHSEYYESEEEEVEADRCDRCRGSGREPCPGRERGYVCNPEPPASLCEFCCGLGALPLLAPGICARCNRPSEAHHREAIVYAAGSPFRSRFDLCCTPGNVHYEERPSPLALPWPRSE